MVSDADCTLPDCNFSTLDPLVHFSILFIKVDATLLLGPRLGNVKMMKVRHSQFDRPHSTVA